MEILNTVLKEFLDAMQGSFSSIQSFGYTLIYYMIGIQLIMTAIWGMMRGGVLEMTVKLIQAAFIASVFITLIMFTGEWMPILINGLMDVGSKAGHITSLSPSAVIDQGLSIGMSIFDGFGTFGFFSHPFLTLSAVVLMFVIIIIYSLIAAELALVLVFAYVLVALGPMFWAFGGLEVTREMAKNYFKKVIGTGLQLLTLYLLIGVGVTIGGDWAVMLKQAAENSEITPFFVVMAAVIIYYLIIKNIPAKIGELSGVGGFHNQGDAAAGLAINAGMQGARMAMTATGVGGMAAQGAGQLAKFGSTAGGVGVQAFKDSDGGAFRSTGKLASAIAGKTAKSMGSAIKQSVMKENKGRSFGQKMNQQMQNHLNTMKQSSSSQDSGSSVPNSSARSNTIQRPKNTNQTNKK